MRKVADEYQLTLRLSELDPETNEEKEIDSVTVDISCVIFPSGGKTYEWRL